MDDITQEKLTTIARNQQEIYNNGIAEGNRQGRQDVISKSKYIPKTASGKGVFLDDVSEVAHKVKVYADTPTEVTVCGKNLIPFPYNSSMPLSQNGITLTINDDGSIVANGTASDLTQFHIYHCYFVTNPISILPNIKYTLSGCTGGSSTTYEMRITDSKTSAVITQNAPTTFSYADTSQIVISILVRSGATLNNVVFKPQVEYGENYTGFEPYQEPQTITATLDGAEADSLCPNMSFLTDGEITVDYYASYGMTEKELAMWRALTFNGARKQYQYAFANTDYTGFVIPDGMCKPSSTIAYMLYNYQGIEAPKGIDCSGFNGTNQTSQGNFTFYNSPNLIKIYDMGIPAGILLNNTYSYCRKLEEIEIIRCNENTTFTSAFISCAGLIKVIFSGRIASDINLQWSTKLSLESLISLFSCLKVYSSDDADYCTKTITLSAESWALTESQDFQDALGYTDGQAMCRDLGWNYA